MIGRTGAHFLLLAVGLLLCAAVARPTAWTWPEERPAPRIPAHDGSARMIGEAIDRHGAIVSRLDRRNRKAIEAFLGALTDLDFVSDQRLSLPQSACGAAL